jgi:hypothetical protein
MFIWTKLGLVFVSAWNANLLTNEVRKHNQQT